MVSLLNKVHIKSLLKKLNNLLADEEWVEENKESLTMVGVRIPLQDLSFTSSLIVRKFLPASEGDLIILPPEFYKQVGSDNDIDTVTVSMKHLNKETGKPIS